MPPPPPPSKSYLLVIDSDSSDDEEDSYRIHHRDNVTVTSTTNPTTVLELPSPLDVNGRRRRPHHVSDNEEDYEDDDDDDELINVRFIGEDACSSPRTTMESPASQDGDEDDDDDDGEEPLQKLTKNQKKKRARRRNKKKSKSCQATNPRISFSTVSTRIYPRAFSQVSVPADGGWPLGMELKPLEAIEELSLEEFEAHKQQRLKERWEHLLQVQAVDEKVLEQMTKRPPTGEPFALETRQWDYCYKIKNPLFGALSEDQRRDIFLESESESGEGSFPAKGRVRSNSVTDHGNNGGSSPKRRGRSSSFSHGPEQFTETYNQVYVHHVRSDLEKLRIERTTSGSTGCTCRKLTVYVPPKDGGGKKAQHRRLKPSKLREELKKRNLYDESKPRETLEQTLHDAVEKEPCCGTSDCFCRRNGLDCQADACSCWHDSHVHTKTNVRHLSMQTIKQRCGNPLGTVTVDMDAIDAYRNRVLEASMCQFITTGQ